MLVQRVADRVVRGRVAEAMAVAREERVELTTPQPAGR
jgi:hypothetical protein